MPTLSRTALYWLLQAVGWLTLLLISLFFVSVDKSLANEPSTWFPILTICLVGMALTHVFRLCLKRWKLHNIAIWKLIPLVLGANLIMSALLVGIFIVYAVLMENSVDFSEQILSVANLAVVFIIWSLIYFVIFGFRNYRREEIERLKAEQAMRESELARLKSQMNPHFVFNALNSIRALVAEDPDKAQQSITQLSHLLRGFLLSDRHRTVTLSEELRTVLDYLELEKLRYEQRLEYRIDISPQAEEVQVPTMMVQTLVENAIKHGISKTVEGGEIDIRARVEQGMLLLEIENSGNLQGSPFRQDGGFGLANTHIRLQLIYGDRSYFDVFQAKPGRVVAQVKLPAGLTATTILETNTPLPLSA